jgi:hypothetical protein
VESDITVTVTVTGLREPNLAAMHVVNHVKRALFGVNGYAEEFGAVIESMAPGMNEPERIVLTPDGTWQRGRDLNPRGPEPNGISSAAP